MTALITPTDIADRLGRELSEGETLRVEMICEDVSATIRAYTGQNFTQETVTSQLQVVGRFVKLPQRPVLDVTAVTDSHGNELTYTWTSPAIELELASSWYLNIWELNLPYRGRLDKVNVTYEYGYADDEIPDDIVAVACSMGIRALATPADDAGITQESIGSYSYQRANTSATSIWEPERRILDRYRVNALPALMLR